ncbi:hypothetical protein CaCOL14_007568 [Colletotrichum acutatum]
MKVYAIALLLSSSLATAGIARVVCQQPPREWGNGNCNGDDTWACGQRCGRCIDENDQHGYAGFCSTNLADGYTPLPSSENGVLSVMSYMQTTNNMEICVDE